MKYLKQFWYWMTSFEISLKKFDYTTHLNFKAVPGYYVKDSLSDGQKLKEDWKMVLRDVPIKNRKKARK